MIPKAKKNKKNNDIRKLAVTIYLIGIYVTLNDNQFYNFNSYLCGIGKLFDDCLCNSLSVW